MKRKIIIVGIFFVLSTFLVAGCLGGQEDNITDNETDDQNQNLTDNQVTGKVDDWQYNPNESGGVRTSPSPGGSLGGAPSGGAQAAPEAGSGSIGISVGGAKDINNYRDNLENDYLPIPTDITYEGLFYDYYFNTGQEQECTELFCPSYSQAVTKDPVSNETERYMTVGLNSGLKKEDFERKKLNLVVVLDISGSMSSGFNKYYYDRFGNQKEIENVSNKSKIQVATESVAAMTEHLNDDDRFGMVLFNNEGKVAKPMNLAGDTDMEAIRDHIEEIRANGGTRMSQGMNKASDMLKEYQDVNQSEYENRVIFLTDAMPNLGTTSEEGLFSIMEENSQNNIYSTFVGIGVDFNTNLTERITGVEGANYYSVHSSDQFNQRMDDGFEYMVNPLAFDLELSLESQGYEIERVYGSPEAEESTGELMKVNTLFPSAKKDGKTKGGVVLLKLNKTSSDTDLELEVSYEDRQGNSYTSSRKISFEEKEPEYFENTGVRKAVLLTRYADLAKNWMIDERKDIDENITVDPAVTEEKGIVLPPVNISLGKWERQSTDLTVSSEYKEVFGGFKGYFEEEMNTLGDENLQQELDILEKLSNYG